MKKILVSYILITILGFYFFNIFFFAKPCYGEGVAEENEPIAISTPIDKQIYPSVAFDSIDRRFFVVWHDLANGLDIYGRPVGDDGSLIGNEIRFAIKTSGCNPKPSITFDSINGRFLLVWRATREIQTDTRKSDVSEIYGQLINPDGSLFGSQFLIEDHYDKKIFDPTAIFDYINKRFLVIWNYEKDEPNRGKSRALFYRFVNLDGGFERREPSCFLGFLRNDGNESLEFSIAFDPMNKKFLLVEKYSEHRNKIKYHFFKQDLNRFEKDFFIETVGVYSNSSVSFDQENKKFLIIWREDKNIYGQFIDAEGKLIEGKFKIFSIQGTLTELSSMGLDFDSHNKRFLITWSEAHFTTGYDMDIYGIFWPAKLKEIPFSITLAAKPQNGDVPLRIDFVTEVLGKKEDISEYAWDFDGNGIYDRTTNTQTTSYNYNFTGVYFAKVKVTDKDNNSATASLRLDINEKKPEEIFISSAPRHEYESRIAFDSINRRFLVVWADRRNEEKTHSDIFGQLVDKEGNLIDENFSICIGPGSEYHPQIEFDPVNKVYLVAWQDLRHIYDTYYARFIDIEGNLIGREFIITEPSFNIKYSALSLKFDPKEEAFLVMYRKSNLRDTEFNNLYLRRINARSNSIGKEVCLSFGGHGVLGFDFINRRILLVKKKGDYGKVDICAEIYDFRGNLIKSEFAISTAPGSQFASSVSFDPISQRFLISWKEWGRDYKKESEYIGSQLVDKDGNLIGKELLVGNNASMLDLPVSSILDPINKRFLLAWTDSRDLKNTQTDIYGQFINSDGSLNDINFSIIKRETYEAYPNMAIDSIDGKFLITWDDYKGGIWGKILKFD